MKKSIIARCLVLALLLGPAANPVWSQGKPGDEQARRIRDHAEPLARQGNATAQYNMGVLYDEGYDGKPDYAKAREWYRKAADQGYAKAEHNLAILYQKGRGVTRNPAKAAHWFKRAAEHGEPAAQNNLAVLYVRGEGVPRDRGQAAKWAARAAKAGNKSAHNNISHIIGNLSQRRIDGDDVNIRARPSTDSEVVRQAKRGTRVSVIAQDHDWSQILFPDSYDTGWVADFLLAGIEDTSERAVAATQKKTRSAQGVPVPKTDAQPDAQTAAAGEPAQTGNEASGDAPSPDTAAADHPTRYIDSAVVNIRRRPTTESDALFQVRRNDRVTVLGNNNGWRRVRLDDGREGWVAGFLLRD